MQHLPLRGELHVDLLVVAAALLAKLDLHGLEKLWLDLLLLVLLVRFGPGIQLTKDLLEAVPFLGHRQIVRIVGRNP